MSNTFAKPVIYTAATYSGIILLSAFLNAPTANSTTSTDNAAPLLEASITALFFPQNHIIAAILALAVGVFTLYREFRNS